MKTVLISALLLIIAVFAGADGALDIPDKHVRQPLPYRIVSFHQGRADKDLIRRAARLGYNGVQFQLEGGNVRPLTGFAEREKKEGYVDFCHGLGMKVTVWVHEFSEIPGKDSPRYLGPIELGNEKLWSHISERYDWILGELLPNIDGIVLTVVETQVRATDSRIMTKLVGVIRDKCRKHNKELIVRTFVWYPKEFTQVMDCIKGLPDDVVIMTKCVPQDWQMRGINDKAIGDVGNHAQIVEYDIAGEYFLRNYVANCMPQRLADQFSYGLTKGVDGICARVDRGDSSVLDQLSEVNLWALGMFASGCTDSVDDVWNAWAAFRYGTDAADKVIAALKPTQFVVEEMLDLGTLTYGDTRGFPPNVDKDPLRKNWSNFLWDMSYMPEYNRAVAGDPEVIRKTEQSKREALRLAEQCLGDLESAKSSLQPADYDILYTRLLTNKVQLEYRSSMMLAYLRYMRVLNTSDALERQSLATLIRGDLRSMRIVARRKYSDVRTVEHRDRKWSVGAPGSVNRDQINGWADRTEALLRTQGL